MPYLNLHFLLVASIFTPSSSRGSYFYAGSPTSFLAEWEAALRCLLIWWNLLGHNKFNQLYFKFILSSTEVLSDAVYVPKEGSSTLRD